MESAMKTTTKRDETAGLAEQILPGSRALPVPPLPKVAGESSATTKGLSAEDLAAAKLSPLPVRADVSEPAAATRPVSPMVRISDIVSREVRMFRRAADDLVEVVLTPDAKTQISLRLQWRDGQVEAQARCDFGDFKALNTQWPQLQTTLASQGVRLSHLSERPQTGFTDFFTHPNFAQSQGADRRQAEAQSPADQIVSAPVNRPAVTPAVNRVNRPNPLLESWG
jgi:hypothetical protein